MHMILYSYISMAEQCFSGTQIEHSAKNRVLTSHSMVSVNKVPEDGTEEGWEHGEDEAKDGREEERARVEQRQQQSHQELPHAVPLQTLYNVSHWQHNGSII